MAALKIGWSFLAAYAVYVVLTRLLVSLVLFSYSPRVDFNYVWCLYANQIVNATVKLYMLWRLPNQRWSNRGNQCKMQAARACWPPSRSAMAGYLTALSIGALCSVCCACHQRAAPAELGLHRDLARGTLSSDVPRMSLRLM